MPENGLLVHIYFWEILISNLTCVVIYAKNQQYQVNRIQIIAVEVAVR